MQLAKQGFTSLRIEEYDTDWNSKAYYTVSGQNSNNSVRIDNAFMKAVRKRRPLAPLLADREGEGPQAKAAPPKPRKTLRGPRPVGPDRLRRLVVRRSGRAVRHHHQRMAHLPGGWADQCVEPVLGIHVPRRHGLQSGVAELAQVLRCARQAGSTSNRSATPCRLWTLILEISVYMAQFPSKSVAQKSYDYRTLGLGYANLGSLLMVQGIPYDSPEGRAQCGAITALMHAGVLRHVGGDRRRGRAVPALRGQPRGDAARHPQPSPGRLQRPGRRIRRADHHAGRHRRDATAPTICCKPPSAKATACWSSARNTATAMPR